MVEMSDLVKKCTDMLRVRTDFWLLEDENVEMKVSRYPFDNNKMPVMCQFSEGTSSESYEAYESGNRSIIYYDDGRWFKAKGIGIPRGISRPIYHDKKIYTYQLYGDLDMCHHSAIWGYMEKVDLNCELYGVKETNELGMDIETSGFGEYKKGYYISFKDRRELFNFLKSSKESDRLKKLFGSSILTQLFSFYSFIPSDLRVQELLFVFMFPQIEYMLDTTECKEYVRWLGSSCGYRLRQLHEVDLLHGTWIGDRKAEIGLADVHSNSYTGNHTITEEDTWLVDFDLAKTSKDDSLKDLEKWCLINMENPLFYAGSYLGNEALRMGLAKKNTFREELARQFVDGVNEGYDGEIHYIEKQLRRNMLEKLCKSKQFLWELFKLPKDLIGDIYYIDALMLKTTLKDIDIKKAVNAIQI